MHYYIIIIKTIESIILAAQENIGYFFLFYIRQKNGFNAGTYMKMECKLRVLQMHYLCETTQ